MRTLHNPGFTQSYFGFKDSGVDQQNFTNGHSSYSMLLNKHMLLLYIEHLPRPEYFCILLEMRCLIIAVRALDRFLPGSDDRSLLAGMYCDIQENCTAEDFELE